MFLDDLLVLHLGSEAQEGAGNESRWLGYFFLTAFLPKPRLQPTLTV